jgi:hypothetical protein
MSLSGAEKAHRLQKALEYGGASHRLDDVVSMLKAGKAQLWENEGGVIVTELDEYPLLKTVHFWLMAGQLHDVLALEHEIIPWAVENGCTKATGIGRPGWGRVAAKTGWRPWLPHFYKELTPPDGT